MTSRKLIFLADDDLDDCVLFQDALMEISTESVLTTANDGIELIRLLEMVPERNPDVIFLDLNMPKRNGFECLQQIKNSQCWRDIPVVIFSTTGQQEMIHKVYETGANYFIRKPGSFPKLKQAIQEVLSIDWKTYRWQPLSIGM
ncbi:response regulator receiver domain-containing protein [Dyadobacter jejuensis]|uniref:Response regulator receiver domain-containing protein n=1 Tax=Dyadobacter jejuensis TaxID=1082580 RepID=A0A316AIH7_9BACT|nr:response regulator [Dyadobacter jejuensis]PWJ57451.1 response regulator receiver domain-containing protein [Dyadobacter jejuensis]